MNNNDNLEKFISEIESIKMTLNEKNEMRNHLTSFAMNYVPTVSPYHKTMLLMRRSLAVAFVAILSVGSLSNVVSGQALPGDTLYPVKIAHEEIKLATTVDTKKKISYEIRRTEKRIQEATKLASQNDLDSETQTEIAETIKKQANKVKVHIREVKEDNPEEALVLNAELKSTIKINAEALKQVSTTIEQQEVVAIEKEIAEVEEILPEDETLEDSLINEDTETVLVIEDTKEIAPEILESEYVSVEVSFAESLLGSIEKEVREIEAFENQVSEELIKEEKELDEEPLPKVTIEKDEVENTNSEITNDFKEEKIKISAIQKEINSLEDILNLKKQIKGTKAKLTLSEDFLAITDIFDEELIYANVDMLLQAGKYKNSFILLQEVLTYYQEQLLVKYLAFDLGIQVTAEADIPLEKEIILEEEIPMLIELEDIPEEEIEKTLTE
jgi:hypothetical protein